MANAEAYKYLVLGGGNAAGYVGSTFKEQGLKPGELAIVSDEPVVSYERPTLSKAYLFPDKPARLPAFHTIVGGGGEARDETWYKKNGIDFLTDTKVTGVNIKEKTVSTTAGELSYDKLIIALGSVAVNLADSGTEGATLDNIFYLRNKVDGDALLKGIEKAKAAGNKAVVVGGGYIGLEVAAALAKNSVDTTIVMPSDRFMPRLFTPEIAAFYEKYYEDKGIKIIKEQHVTGFEGDGRVQKALTKNGDKLDADLVVVGIGARPNIDLFKDQLDLLDDKPGGIKVDSHLQTSEPGVYAIGDVVAFPLKQYGNTITRQEHVAHARQSAAQVVSHILAPDSAREYDYFPVFYSRVFDLGWQFYGDNQAEKTIFFGSTDLKSPHFGTYFIDKDGKVIGIFLESGSDEENSAARKLAEKRPSAPSDLKEQGFKFLASK